MKKYILLFPIIFLNESSFCQNLKNDSFELLNDFEHNKSLFTQSIWDWNDSKGAYGMAYRSNQREYIVLDLYQFSGMSKSNYLYISDKNLNIKIVKVIYYLYDKKWNDESKNVTRIVEYVASDGKNLKRYNVERNEIKNPKTDSLIMNVEHFFTEATQSLR